MKRKNNLNTRPQKDLGGIQYQDEGWLRYFLD